MTIPKFQCLTFHAHGSSGQVWFRSWVDLTVVQTLVWASDLLNVSSFWEPS
jgi:hypothetical protein